VAGDGHLFATAEHWMMWSKAKLFGDNDIAVKILASALARTTRRQLIRGSGAA
jgi:predicted NAD-dependent protein-ADP-ribosyltransferase YbiA (DUF1768 family)